MDDTFLSKIDISMLKKTIFNRYKLLPMGFKNVDFVKAYLEQLPSHYTLRESKLSVDVLVRDLLRMNIPSEDGTKI